MPHKIFRNIPRPDAQAVKLLGELGVATIHEAQGRTGAMLPHMRPMYPTARVSGPAVTVLCHPGDNLMIHASVEVCKPGDVLVVVTTSESTDGMFGDLLGTSCQAHGVAGLVIDAGVRDTADLTEMKFPVWAKAVSPQGTVKASPGSVNVPVVCAGVIVNPGDVIIGDADGVVVVPRAEAADVAKAGQQRIAKEVKTRERLAKGELGVDFYGLRAKLKELGVEYVEELAEEPSANGRIVVKG
ncbi:MAG: 4-carboxy-4-hydroxy-2-oxoadipate aldolase/oxaloacetate decarboxylase [Bryobacteraceae bacterium]|jgi:4-hydroxy-4-methyl-2-oxoglutarate aldolase